MVLLKHSNTTAIRLNHLVHKTDTQDLTAELFHPYNVPDHNYTGTLLANNYGKNDILTSEFGTATFTDDYTSQAFTDTSTPADTVSGGDFIQPGLHNYTGTDNRNFLAQLDTAENLTITVTTNSNLDTFDANTSGICL